MTIMVKIGIFFLIKANIQLLKKHGAYIEYIPVN